MCINPNYGVPLALTIGHTLFVNSLEFLEIKSRDYERFANGSTQQITLIITFGLTLYKVQPVQSM